MKQIMGSFNSELRFLTIVLAYVWCAEESPLTKPVFASYLDWFCSKSGHAHHGHQGRVLLLLIAKSNESVAFTEARSIQDH